jgi:hypothetical protein
MKLRLAPEERAPCGVPGGLTVVCNRFFPFKTDFPGDLSDCLVSQPKPFRLVIWDPLRTKAPAPPKARPYCCYIQTVIFYHFPYIRQIWPGAWRSDDGALRRQTAGYEEWDKIEFRLAWDDVVEYRGALYVVGSGHVVWKQRRWWMLHHARSREARP